MSRKPLVVLVSMMMLFAIAPNAGAESQTVDGTGDIKKMFASNGEKAVTVKVFGIGKPCDVAHFVHIIVKWGATKAYKVEAGCYPGGVWAENLYFLNDRTNPESARLVECDDFKMTYNADKVFHKAFMPRKCLEKAANRVKVSSEAHNYPSTTGGEAGPTRRLNRG